MNDKTQHLVDELRRVFQERRYGGNAEYHPDFDLFDAAADEIIRLRAKMDRSQIAADLSSAQSRSDAR